MFFRITQENVKMPYDINEVADYVITQAKSEDKNSSLTNLKLQKILYYIQAWSYGIYQRPFYNDHEEFQAWIHGPVNRTIYNRFEPTKYLYSEIDLSDLRNAPINIDDEGKEFIDFILENYMKFSGSELESMTHKEMPWKLARKGLSPTERCENIITPESMMAFYGKRWQELQNNA